LCSYETERDLITASNVSQLSPHLHFGEIDVHAIYSDSRECAAEHPACAQSAASFQRQLIWREFTHFLMAHHPNLGHQPLDPAYAKFPWGWDTELFARWRDGQTGYPIVDAAMRQLTAEGWMPNRARMVVASFLVKHLLLHWQLGAAWFWERLVDADLPNNSFGWQWAAGCGADAAPYFRIFNPVTQSQKFDPGGDYIRQFVPELATLPPQLIHFPANCAADELARHAPGLWQRYPRPVVAHADARERALAVFQRFKLQQTSRS
jgi:deoxyribodipyrimidine photo-lyase